MSYDYLAEPFVKVTLKSGKPYLPKKLRDPVELWAHELEPTMTLEAALKYMLEVSVEKYVRPLYREVSLVWRCSKRTLTLYTLRRDSRTWYDDRIRKSDLVFVAHTHPLQSQIDTGATYVTDEPTNPHDWVNLMPRKCQYYAVIMHLDLKDETTPKGLIYDRHGNRIVNDVTPKQVAEKYIELEKKKSTRAAKIRPRKQKRGSGKVQRKRRSRTGGTGRTEVRRGREK